MGKTMWEGAEIDWPRDATLPELVDANAAKKPDGIVLIDAVSARTVTNAQLASLYRRAANGLAERGFGRGDCLCTLMPNSLAWYVAALAAQSLGGTISGINPLATPGEIARQFSRVPTKAILAFLPLAETANAIASAQGVSILLSSEAGLPGVPSLFDIGGDSESREHRCFCDDPALLPFSSGTTGLPKPVVVTHRNLIAGGCQVPPLLRVDVGARFLGLAPLFHIVGPNLFVVALMTGSAVVIVPRFDPMLIFDAIEKFAVTHVPVMAPILRALARHPAAGGRDFSRLKVVAASGAPLFEVVQAEAAAFFGCPVTQVYGMTESSSAITVDDPADTTPGSVGLPVPLSRLRIIDVASGRPLPANRDGEIQVAGPNIMQGYLGLPAETAKVITEDGWLRTGDVGWMGNDGKLRITGRIKELIKVNGGQVAPAELELLLTAHPAVADAIVIGRDNPYSGEVPVAYVALNAPADPFAIMDWVNEQVIHYKRIRAIEIIEVLPRTATGKADRNAVLAEDSRRRRGPAAGQSAGRNVAA
ncbi:MAG: AMP-dependent synthetase [Alphaproteobacteria bacterium]|nr:MAG: AMP-dependent synthetase [Alphaproteobacteria bacterium]